MCWRIGILLLLVLSGCGTKSENRSSPQETDNRVTQSSDKGPPSQTLDASDSRRAPQRPLSSFPKSHAEQPREPQNVGPAPAESTTGPIEAGSTRTWKDGERYKTVTVFYGTDRARTYDDIVGLGWRVAHFAILGIIMVIGLITAVTLTVKSRYRYAALTSLTAIALAVLYVKYVPLNMPMRMLVADKGIPKYGGERGKSSVGTCKVTIPRTHNRGELESPDIRRFEINEDVRKHLVLADVQPLQSDAFYEQLRLAVARSPKRDLFIFVHGYNVTFENAARRTAQMAFDLEFDGAPVFYSWPSQGGYLQYTVDQTNIGWAAPDVKQFLLDVARHSGAKSINLIAHSMGNRALTQALRDISLEMNDDPRLFNELILAAPDIDAGRFKRDIAPFIQKTARRTTLYASSTDSALIAAKTLHGGPRAGDGGENLLLVPGIHTIDVSNIEADVLGHSYYASSDLVLSDLKALFDNAAPKLRQWLREVKRDELKYWVYQKARTAITADRRALPQP